MTKKESYLVEGMSCSMCEQTVEKSVKKLEGMKQAKANLQTSTLSIEYDPEKVDADQVRSAVNAVGYRIVGERPPLGQREGRDDAIA